MSKISAWLVCGCMVGGTLVPGVLADSLAGWTLLGGTWTADGGVLTASGPNGPKALREGVSPSDFELDVEIMIHAAGTQAGVLFRVDGAGEGTDAHRGYFAGLHAGDNQVLWGASDGGWSEIARKPVRIEPGRWHRCRLQAQGGNVKFFVGGQAVDGVEYPRIDGLDTRFSEGQVGLRVLGGKASFRNLRIRDLPEKPAVATYTNPVAPGCADPVVLRHGGMYYAYFTHTLGVPRAGKGIRMYASPDLVHWTDHGYVLKNKDSWGDSRFWAPDIVERNGTFYLYYAAEERICVATADSPLGPFRQAEQKPMLPETIRIDAHVFQDDDGQYYFYYVHFNRGNEIWGGKLNDDMVSVDPSSLRLMVKPDQPWEQHMARIVEGPEVVKHNGTYYLTYSGSHFKSPHYAVGYATSNSPLGPWEKYGFNPIMKSSSYAHGTAHHCLTTSPDGREMFIVYHRHYDLTNADPRQMAIDRIRFVPQDNGPDALEVWGPTVTPQPMPSGAR